MKKELTILAVFTRDGEQVGIQVGSAEVASIGWLPNAVSFRIHERTDVVDNDGERYVGALRAVGPTYWHPASSVQSLERMLADARCTPALVEHAREHGWKMVVWTRFGLPEGFDPEVDEVLDEAKELEGAGPLHMAVQRQAWDVLNQVAQDDALLEVGRLAIEDELANRRDARFSELGRRNGFVIAEKDGSPSDVIRCGAEVGLAIALRAIAEHLHG